MSDSNPVHDAIALADHEATDIPRVVLTMVKYTSVIPSREDANNGAYVPDFPEFVKCRNLAVADVMAGGKASERAEAVGVTTRVAGRLRKTECYEKCREEVVGALHSLGASTTMTEAGRHLEQAIAHETIKDAMFSVSPAARSKAQAALVDRVSGKKGRDPGADLRSQGMMPMIPPGQAEEMVTALKIIETMARKLPDGKEVKTIDASRVPLVNGNVYDGTNELDPDD